jgi:hypothetical protein
VRTRFSDKERRALGDHPIREALYVIFSALIAAGMKIVDTALIQPDQLANRPLYVFSFQYEFLVAAAGILIGAHSAARARVAHKLNVPLFGLAGAIVITFISVAISTQPWAAGLALLLGVGLPNLVSVVMLS